jgi:hypothetical protein
VKLRPSLPTLICLKNTGPFDETLMAMAIITSTGNITSKASSASKRSNKYFKMSLIRTI